MESKDYYLILGVDRSVDANAIKSAYRKLARKYHPDVSTDSDAEGKFKEVQKAYETLKSCERRAAYDQRFSTLVDNQVTDRLPVEPLAFWGGLQWMTLWNSWWAWQSVWGSRLISPIAD